MSPRRLEEGTAPRCLWLVGAGLIGLAGYLGPWVPHAAAGLVVSGLDLAEYVKFLPQWAAGQIRMPREVFYLPLLATSVGASLLGSRRRLPTWARWLLGLAAIPTALAMLPPAWSPAALASPEFRLQTLLIFLCLALVPGVLLTRYLPYRLVMVVIGLLALMAAIWPAWGFLQVLAPINELYRHPVGPGWGFWATSFGFLIAAFLATAEILRRPTVRNATGRP